MNSNNGYLSRKIESTKKKKAGESSKAPHQNGLVSNKVNSADSVKHFVTGVPEEETSDFPEAVEIAEKPKNILCIQFGKFEINTSYYSPYPGERAKPLEKLFICEFCLKYMELQEMYDCHTKECTYCCPPGSEIYRKGTLSIYEIDAVTNKIYCQNLCLFAKLFLEHKFVFYDCSFFFYVLCEMHKSRSHIIGYFSKAKSSPDGYNLSCLMVLPPYQRQGYGKLLISFSYQLSILEGVAGTPEDPLSELATVAYNSYWCWVILKALKEFNGSTTITVLSVVTGFAPQDILTGLRSLKMLKYCLDDDSVRVPPDIVDARILSGRYKRPRLTVDPLALVWLPPSWRNNKVPSDSSVSSKLVN